MNEKQLDFLIVRQKDKILQLINHSRKKEALIALDVVKELWDHCDYTYKYDEIKERINQQ